MTSLATPAGHEVDFGIGGYKYVEPGDTSISIHGPKFGGGYTGTIALNSRQHWFLQANARGLLGSTTYDGWCSPFLITPDNRSPNGYALDLGDPSPCSESGDTDWYVEGRALVGKDFIGRKWGWSPDVGLGIRHLSNGTTGVAGYRTDDYLYLPVGITARTVVGSHALSFNLEYDHLLHGWQRTRDSQLGTQRREHDAAAEVDRVLEKRWSCPGDTDCTRVHDRRILRHLVRSGLRMGAARTCEIPGDQALVGGA